MTHEDFISAVKKFLKSSQVAFSKTGPDNINSEFSSKDIEVGKIYMVWPKNYGWGKSMVWFLTPYERIVGDKFKLYWCSGLVGQLQNEVIRLMHNNQKDIWWDEQRWVDFTWAGDDWVEISSINNNNRIFINWDKEPWSGK